MDTYNKSKKPSQAISWLGFGIGLGLLILLWVINLFFIFATVEDNEVYVVLILLTFLVGGILGILTLIFSIVGLFNANRNGLKKYPSVLGIIFFCISLISAFVPLFCTYLKSNKQTPVEVVADASIEGPAEAQEIKVIELTITHYGEVECREQGDPNVATLTGLSKYRFEREFTTWLELHGLDERDMVLIQTSNDSDYNSVSNVVEVLQNMGFENYKLN